MTAFAQRFGHGLGAMRIAQEFAPSRALSSIRAEDHGKTAARKTAEPLDIEGDIALLSESLAESHRYRDRDPISFIKHRNLRLAKYIGFDLADALDMRESWLHDLSLGVEWPKIKAVVPDSDRSNPAAPAITMGIAF
ncbi:hypothetical protein WBP06_17425 [Novosphingobium sp. BL-8H]|uniref:hypothetical protein n=1 Tax=Novosphingobium sp. BL-8H TaxID=3127640 RepID=UPI003758264F